MAVASWQIPATTAAATVFFPDRIWDFLPFTVLEVSKPQEENAEISYAYFLADMLGTERVVPVVLFLRGAARAPRSFALGTERHVYLTFDYVPCKLAEMPGEDWMDSRNLVSCSPDSRWWC